MKVRMERAMTMREKWKIESHAVRLPDGRFAPSGSATYLAEPRPDKHSLQWLEPTFTTEAEATEWGLSAVSKWLDDRLDSGE